MNIEKLKQFVIRKLEDELSHKLSYHNVYHTIRVLAVCNDYIDRLKLSTSDARLLSTAALFHDTGFIWIYSGHEERSIVFAREILPHWDYTTAEINIIEGLIRATIIPQQPYTLLEQIIGDADLDYLGTDSFITINETLFEELLAFGKIQNRKEWEQMQIKFLQDHGYHTTYAQQYREPVKQAHLNHLLATYL